MKNKNKIKLPFELNKKNIIIMISALCGLIIIAGVCIGIKAYKKRLADRTVKVAFYGLSEEITELLKGKIPQEENIILKFDVIPAGDLELEAVKGKYDILFTWRGDLTDALTASAEDIPAKLLESMPNSVRNKKCVPILLDHCELTFSKDVVSKAGGEIPLNYDDFYSFLKTSKSQVFSPFFCNGGDDRILIDFIGAMVMAKGGLKAYNKLIEEMREAESLEDLMDAKLDGKSFTLRSVLDELKTWPKDGLTHPSWYNGNGNDLLFFAEDKNLACFFTLLSEHRKIKFNVIKNYESSLIPPNQSASNYGLIAPAVSCMLLSDNSNCKRYITGFFTEDAQTELSDKTNLAPVHYRAQAYDRQADDVRFWAASCAGGAVPDIYNAVYQRKTAALKKMAADIRSYLR